MRCGIQDSKDSRKEKREHRRCVTNAPLESDNKTKHHGTGRGMYRRDQDVKERNAQNIPAGKKAPHKWPPGIKQDSLNASPHETAPVPSRSTENADPWVYVTFPV